MLPVLQWLDSLLWVPCVKESQDALSRQGPWHQYVDLTLFHCMSCICSPNTLALIAPHVAAYPEAILPATALPIASLR